MSTGEIISVVIDKERGTAHYVQPSNFEKIAGNLARVSGLQFYFFRALVMKLPRRRCVKVTELRPYYTDLKQWMEDFYHLLVTRHGRIFVNKVIFTYPASEWANPYKVGEHSLEKALILYEQHLRTKLQENECLTRFKKLRDAEELGCFCLSKDRCHIDVILKILREIL